MSAHALLAPSKAPRWLNCVGSIAAEVAADIKDEGSIYANEGSAAHVLGERALLYAGDGKRADFWKGETITIDGDSFTVDDEMAENVQVYVDQVMREPGELLVEQKFDLSEVFGVADQFGTGDAVVLDYENERLYVGDLKYGRGVIVFAKDNDQLYSYAAGALKEYEFLADWKTITVAIHQPRLHHYDEHTITRDELEAWMANAKEKAILAMLLVTDATPEGIEAHKVAGEKQCLWCPLKGTCKTLATWSHEQIYADFTNLQTEPTTVKDTTQLDGATLGQIMQRADVITKWLKEVRAEGVRRAQAIPGSVPGWKMVQGKKGNRQWSSASEAEAIMKAARIKSDDMYSKTLLTLPAAEKAFAKSKPKIWVKLKALLTQKEGAPAIAPESDARPALDIAASDQFADLTGDGDDISDLL